MAGGIDQLELDHGTKWRPWKINQSLQKRLSRIKAVALEYQRQIVDNNVTKDEALAVMEVEWSAAKSVSKYADALHKKATAAQRAKEAAQNHNM